ncbi:MAG: hypothetical protein NTV04_21605, partial [Deltaproteobacteria bacterium]|nr:hypothetical protein [Deltaproteobacteria bacterium]
RGSGRGFIVHPPRQPLRDHPRGQRGGVLDWENGAKGKRNATAHQAAPDQASKEAIKKWDGHLPRFAGGNALPFIGLKYLDEK